MTARIRLMTFNVRGATSWDGWNVWPMPLLLVLPQPIDLEWIERRGDYYGAFWASLGGELPHPRSDPAIPRSSSAGRTSTWEARSALT